MTSLLKTTLALMLSLAVCSASRAINSLNPGDLVFSQDNAGAGSFNAVMKANPITGNRTVLSQPGVIGSGPDFGELLGGMALESSGNILLCCCDGGIMRIDPATGNRSIVSGFGVGSGPALGGNMGLDLAPSGDIFATTGLADSIVKVNPFTGTRTLVSGPGLGSGPALSNPSSLFRTAAGDFYVMDANIDAIFFVNGVTGNRTKLSGNGAGSGIDFDGTANDVSFIPGSADLAAEDSHSILRVNSITGARTVLANNTGVGSGGTLNFLEWLSVTSNGMLLATSALDGLFIVNPANGNRTHITGGGFGLGPEIGLYREAVQYVPEPGTLLGVGVLAMSMLRRPR